MCVQRLVGRQCNVSWPLCCQLTLLCCPNSCIQPLIYCTVVTHEKRASRVILRCLQQRVRLFWAGGRCNLGLKLAELLGSVKPRRCFGSFCGRLVGSALLAGCLWECQLTCCCPPTVHFSPHQQPTRGSLQLNEAGCVSEVLLYIRRN